MRARMTLQPSDFTRPLGMVIVALALLSLAGHFWRLWAGGSSLTRFFDLNRERNLPTWFQGMMLLSAAGLLWSIGCDRARRALPQSVHLEGPGVCLPLHRVR